MLRLALVSLLVLLAVGCASSPLPDADDPVDNGLRAAWTAFQDGVRADDTDALRALLDPAPPGGEDIDDVPWMITDITSTDSELKADILATRAQDLRMEDRGLRVFAREYQHTDDEGNTWESGYYIHFRVAADGRAYLNAFLAAG